MLLICNHMFYKCFEGLFYNCSEEQLLINLWFEGLLLFYVCSEWLIFECFEGLISQPIFWLLQKTDVTFPFFWLFWGISPRFRIGIPRCVSLWFLYYRCTRVSIITVCINSLCKISAAILHFKTQNFKLFCHHTTKIMKLSIEWRRTYYIQLFIKQKIN